MIKVGDHSAVVYNSRNIIVILHEDIYNKDWHAFDFYFNAEFVPTSFISLNAKWRGNILGTNINGQQVLAGRVIKPYCIGKNPQDQEIFEAIESSLTDDDSYVKGDHYCCILGPNTTIKNILSKLAKVEEKYLKEFENNRPPITSTCDTQSLD